MWSVVEAELNMQVAARLKMFTTNFISSRIVNELSTKVFRITGGEYEGLLNSVKEYQKLLNSNKEYQNLLNSIKEYKIISKSIKEYQRVSEFIKEYRSKKKDTACTTAHE